MITKYFLITFKLHLVFAGFIIFSVLTQSCEDNPANAPGQFIAGTITFVNMSFNDTTSGHYAISLFAYQSNPYCFVPIRSDKLQINSTTSCYYKMTNVESGTYYVGVQWIPNNQPNALWVLGSYGCDTAHSTGSCSYNAVEFPSYVGTSNISFLSWTHQNYMINSNCP